MKINFETKTYEEAVFELNHKMTFAMTQSIGTGERKLFDEVLNEDETKNMRFLKATIMDCQMQISDFFSFFINYFSRLHSLLKYALKAKTKYFIFVIKRDTNK